MNPRRPAFALAELIVALAIAGLVAAMAIATITRQQRFFRASAELRGARESVRDAMEILTSDIRGASVSDTVRLRADSAIELFTAIGTSVVCRVAGNEVGLPASHASGNSLSAFLTEPDTGDIAVFLVDSANNAGQWKRYRIASFVGRAAGSVCASESAFASDADATSPGSGFALTLTSSLSPAITPGTPVRFIRRARYSLYH